MRKYIILLLLLLVITFTLTGSQKEDIYKVGATPVPHKEILEHIQPILAEQGYEFEIVDFTDYVLPNTSLDSEELIANFFQHVPYLEAQIEEYGYDFVNAGGVHVEPIGLYSKEYENINELPETIEIIISNSPTDRPRLLGVLEEAGLITINSAVTNEVITNSSISNIPSLFTSEKSITFIEVDSALLYTNYNNESGDAVLINGNYALDNNLNPLTDALAIEGSASLYVNIIVCRTEDLTDPFIKTIVEVIQSEEVQQWIRETYEGSVVPAA